MNVYDLARSYMEKSEKRLKILPVLLNEKDYSDVVREAQEIVELSLKGMLRAVGVDPPQFHDVGDLIVEYRDRFPQEVKTEGDVDFIPTEEYSAADAEEAISQAKFIVEMARKVISK